MDHKRHCAFFLGQRNFYNGCQIWFSQRRNFLAVFIMMNSDRTKITEQKKRMSVSHPLAVINLFQKD